MLNVFAWLIRGFGWEKERIQCLYPRTLQLGECFLTRRWPSMTKNNDCFPLCTLMSTPRYSRSSGSCIVSLFHDSPPPYAWTLPLKSIFPQIQNKSTVPRRAPMGEIDVTQTENEPGRTEETRWRRGGGRDRGGGLLSARSGGRSSLLC